jgi:C2 domain
MPKHCFNWYPLRNSAAGEGDLFPSFLTKEPPSVWQGRSWFQHRCSKQYQQLDHSLLTVQQQAVSNSVAATANLPLHTSFFRLHDSTSRISKMPDLTVELVKIVNLKDDSPGVDVADPYVKFDLEQNNRLWNGTNYGRMVSSRKKNERNPVYNETFVFKDIPDLKNMELTCTVMDKDEDSRDDKLGRCSFQLSKMDLEPVPQLFRKKVDNNLFSKDAYIFLKISYGDKVEDADASNLSHVGQAAYECLRTYYSEYHHSLWNVTTGKVVGELHQTPKEAFPGPGDDPHPDGHDDWFPSAMGKILAKTQVWADVLSLGPPDGRFMTAFQNALVTIAKNAQGKKEPVIIRMMFGNIVGMPVNCNAVSRELVKKISPNANIRLWVGAWRRGVSWNHAKIIVSTKTNYDRVLEVVWRGKCLFIYSFSICIF